MIGGHKYSWVLQTIPPHLLLVLFNMVAGRALPAPRTVASMADVVMFILQVVDEVRDVAEGLKENDRQACRLSERVLAVEHPVRNIHEGKKLSSAESLRQLSETLTESRNFLVEYARTSKFTRVLRRKENVDKFTQLGGSLTEGVQALQLDVTVEGWAKEDAADRQEDLKNVMEMMERMERERTDNHAEIMSVLRVGIDYAGSLRRASN